jgi:4'-phosphopantetheinyl transferase
MERKGKPAARFWGDTSASWRLPPRTLALKGDEIHVWRVMFDREVSHIQALSAVLSEDEETRAARFRFDRDREAFIIAHGSLRKILAQYLGMSPGHIRFRYGTHEKPYLVPEINPDELFFNLTHTQRVALVAVTVGREIGLDVERIRSDFASEEIAERYFSPREVGFLHTLPEKEQKESFFVLWTRKEAYVKARGEGLSMPLDEVDVTPTPGVPILLLDDQGRQNGNGPWSVRQLVPALGYVAAVATKGPMQTVRCWDWRSSG